jgi:hypothetical protein
MCWFASNSGSRTAAIYCEWTSSGAWIAISIAPNHDDDQSCPSAFADATNRTVSALGKWVRLD